MESASCWGQWVLPTWLFTPRCHLHREQAVQREEGGIWSPAALGLSVGSAHVRNIGPNVGKEAIRLTSLGGDLRKPTHI